MSNAADPAVRIRASPVPPVGPIVSTPLYSWFTHPAEAFGAFTSMLSKKVPVEINEEFLESMQGVVNLQNPSIERLLEKYSNEHDIVSSIGKRKFAGVRARYQLINLISSMLQYLNEYKKTRSTPLLQISATEDLFDDLVLYLVYLYEKDMATKEVQDKIRALGGRAMELRNTLSQNTAPTIVEALFGRPHAKYQIPAKFNETLNTFISLNPERARIWGVVGGSGVREGSKFPFLIGTDDDDLNIEDLNDFMEQYINMARAIERRKIRVLGDTNYKVGSPTDNAEKLSALERSLDELSTRPDLEALLHFGPSRPLVRTNATRAPVNAPMSARAPANAPMSAPVSANAPMSAPVPAPGGAGFLNSHRFQNSNRFQTSRFGTKRSANGRQNYNANGESPAKRPRNNKKNNRKTRKNKKTRK